MEQPSGALWPVNTLTRCSAPKLIGVDGDMLISQVEFTSARAAATRAQRRAAGRVHARASDRRGQRRGRVERAREGSALMERGTLDQAAASAEAARDRVANTIVRGVVQLADDGKKLQLLQLGALAGETIDNAEHFQPYGFSSVPLAGAEASRSSRTATARTRS
jgi:hypothetical protein